LNWFKFYIGDFQRDTGHLSLTERGAYRALIDHYYATEKPLPNDHLALCRVAGAMTKAERDAVRSAMGFFTLVESGLMHSRIEAELHKAGDVSNTNREIAVAREAARKASRLANESSTNRAQSVHEPQHESSTPRHQTPDTTTPEVKVKTQTARKRAAPAVLVSVDDMVAEGVDRQNATDWLVSRKAKDLPLTPTAWQQTKDEAAKANLTPAQAIKAAAGNGWAGFKALWLEADRKVPNQNTRHAGFETKDYRAGVTADGSLI
jgi:uncharacterized protein YdaU (DUF1376 family)